MKMFRTSKQSHVIRAHIPPYVTQNWKVLSLAGVLLFGMLCGAIISGDLSADGTDLLTRVFGSFFTARQSQTFVTSLVNTMFSSMLLPAVSILFGLCVIGFPFVSVIPFFEGLGIGMLSGYIYSTFGLQGIGYCALVFFPGKILKCAALLFFCKEGMAMSYGLFHLSRGQDKDFELRSELKLYITRILVFFLITAIASCIDTFLSIVFGRFFSFQI